MTDPRVARAAVKRLVDQLDPEGLLRIGAPPDEYDAEIDDFVAAVLADATVTESLVQDIWARWFGPRLKPPPSLSELARRLATIQRLWREGA